MSPSESEGAFLSFRCPAIRMFTRRADRSTGMKGRSGGNAPRPRPLPSEPQGVRHLGPGQQNTPGRGHQHQNCVPDTGSPGSGPGASCRPSRSSEPPAEPAREKLVPLWEQRPHEARTRSCLRTAFAWRSLNHCLRGRVSKSTCWRVRAEPLSGGGARAGMQALMPGLVTASGPRPRHPGRTPRPERGTPVS